MMSRVSDIKGRRKRKRVILQGFSVFPFLNLASFEFNGLSRENGNPQASKLQSSVKAVENPSVASSTSLFDQ